MLYKIKLKNSDETVLLDEQVYDWLTTDPYLKKVDFINNLRRHSSGCAVFQKTWKNPDKSYRIETMYLHKIIAEKFLADTKTDKRKLVGAKDGNKLNCTLDNLEYRTRATASRKRKTTSKTGYTGVYRENKRFRSVISINGKPTHLGMYDTAEEAALAYNKKSQELYGDEGKQNVIVPKSK